MGGATELESRHRRQIINTEGLLGRLVTESRRVRNSHRNAAQLRCHHRLMTHNSLQLEDISFLSLAHNQALMTGFYQLGADNLINDCQLRRRRQCQVIDEEIWP